MGDVAAAAPGEPGAAAAPPVGYGALPGGLHVATAEALPAGVVEVALLSGYGYRKGLLSADHTMKRTLGEVAIGYAPIPHLMLGLSLDGRYDKHAHFNDKTDDGYVGDPHILVRYASPVGRVLFFGGQLNVWVPGKDAPSVALSATSVDARGLVSIAMGFGTLSLDAGFRFDNSAKSVDNPSSLSEEDEVSLGVSKFHAALGGGSLRIPLGRAYVELEGSTEVFVGSGAPGPIVRGGGAFGVALSDAFTAIGFIEAASVPGIRSSDVVGNMIPLVPYEPTITGGLGLQARFGGGQRAEPRSQVTVNQKPTPVTVLETADVSGIVFDDTGKPVVAATVTIKLKNHTGTAVTDSKGAYAIAKLPIGKTVDGKTELDDTGAEVTAEVANKKPGTVTLTLGKGANPVPPITLESSLPPGQLRGVIISVGTSRPVGGATVSIEPGGVTATSGSDGKFTVDLPPGRYRLTVTARGLAQQQLDVTIEQNGVTIKNIELHR
ncbi:MAG TPA: carboxypeptidase regulatory-like domain-containing protein [Kofleriaceae bacterium]|nr:carboxypeptidase regulatory-like domain-containing protein [Kofleriaceae bacterium]